MGCGVCCMKCLLITFNVLFGLVGTLLIVGGALVLTMSGTYIKPFIEETLASIPDLPALFGLQDGEAAPGDLQLNIEELLSSVAIFLIVMGIFILITCILGSFGACCNVECMLYMYAAIVIALFLVQLILVILFFAGALDNTLKKQMQKTIDDKYGGIDNYDVYSLAWNVMMLELECCGVKDYKDFETAKNWKRTREFVGGVEVELTTPVACCQLTTDMEPVDTVCATVPTDAYSNWKTGCWDNMWVAMDDFEEIIIGVSAGVLVFQALCVIAAIVIGVHINKDKNHVA